MGVKPNEFFIDDRDWERASSKARGLKLAAYLDTLTEAQRQHALADCAAELAALNLNPGDFGGADVERSAEEGPLQGFARQVRQRLRPR